MFLKRRFNLIYLAVYYKKKRSFIFDNDLNEWKSTLIDEFKKNAIKAMKIFFDEIFTMQNAEQNRKFKKYAQFIIRMNNAAKFFVYNQLLQIWTNFDFDFQFHVSKFIHIIDLANFIHELNNKKHSWWTLNVAHAKFIEYRRFDNVEQRRDQKNKNKNKQNRLQQDDMLNVNNSTKNRDRENYFFDYFYDNYQRFYYQFDVSLQQSFVSIDFQKIFNQFQNFSSIIFFNQNSY